MSEVIYLFLYDSIAYKENPPLLEGLTCIDLKGNKDVYKRFTNKGINISELPVLIISYRNENRVYPFNQENLQLVVSKINQLVNK